MNSQVFSYEGQFLRQIGGEGVTNYPIGVGINSLGDVVVADNHNNFNLTVFSQVSLQLYYKEYLLSSLLISENEYFLQKKKLVLLYRCTSFGSFISLFAGWNHDWSSRVKSETCSML